MVLFKNKISSPSISTILSFEVKRRDVKTGKTSMRSLSKSLQGKAKDDKKTAALLLLKTRKNELMTLLYNDSYKGDHSWLIADKVNDRLWFEMLQEFPANKLQIVINELSLETDNSDFICLIIKLAKVELLIRKVKSCKNLDNLLIDILAE